MNQEQKQYLLQLSSNMENNFLIARDRLADVRNLNVLFLYIFFKFCNCNL